MSSNAVTLVVPSRFAGPPGTANGGWISGRLAVLGRLSGLAGPVQVTLRQPAPLEVALEVRVDVQGTASLGFGGALIAEAAAGSLTEVVDPVDHATAQAATANYGGWTGHPFPRCFVCGPDRPPPDGLGVFPGRLSGRPDTVATSWLPDGSLAGDDGTSRRTWSGPPSTAPAAGPVTWSAGPRCSAGSPPRSTPSRASASRASWSAGTSATTAARPSPLRPPTTATAGSWAGPRPSGSRSGQAPQSRCDPARRHVAWRHTEGRWSEHLSTYRTREVATS
jgi:hypothetical protein